jgi:dipeptidyl aminopeptidase/acylaminoacyl peptidase
MTTTRRSAQVRRVWIMRLALVITLLMLAGCGGGGEAQVPTLVEIDTLAQSNLATGVASGEITPEPTATETPDVPTLPASYTPTPSPTPTETVAPTVPTPTADPLAGEGAIFYIYNSDSIVTLSPDGSFTQLVATFGVGVRISDLVPSPDGRLLAFVGPGNGSAREVYVATADGASVIRVSCLGFAQVRQPAWSPDGRTLAFIAAQGENQPSDLYVANWEGSGNCPTDNGQRRVADTASTQLGDVTWGSTNSLLFFSNPTIFALNLATGQVSGSFNQTQGFGPDFNLMMRPARSDVLSFLSPTSDPQALAISGILTDADVADLTDVTLRALGPFPAERAMWSADSRTLLLSRYESIVIFDVSSNRTETPLIALPVIPRATFNPDATLVAYVGADPVNPAVQQIFVLNPETEATRQISTHTEGVVNDLIWIGG